MINYIYDQIDRMGVDNCAEDIAILLYNGECGWSDVQEAVDLYFDANQLEYNSKMDLLTQIEQELNCLD